MVDPHVPEVRAPLSPLSAYRSTPRRLVLLPSLLTASAALAAASMPLLWHHHDVPGEGYTAVLGYQQASWLAVGAVLTLAFAVRLTRWGFGMYSRWLLALLTFCVTLGMVVDSINTTSRAASLYVRPYFGPGFYLGLGSAALLFIAALLSWWIED